MEPGKQCQQHPVLLFTSSEMRATKLAAYPSINGISMHSFHIAHAGAKSRENNDYSDYRVRGKFCLKN